MELGTLIDQTRKLLDDVTVAPQLWSDDDIVVFLNEALRDACVRAKLIYDKTSSLTLVTITACPVTQDTPQGFNYLYKLDPSIFEIESAEYVDTKRPIVLISKDTYAKDRLVHRYGYGYGSPGIYGDYNHESAGRADKLFPISNPDESISARLVPMPNTATYVDTAGVTQPVQIRLGVYRTQSDAEELDVNDPTMEPPINRRHHFALIFGAAAIGAARRGRDTIDMVEQKKCEAKFEQAFGPPISANTIRQRHENRRNVTVCHFPR